MLKALSSNGMINSEQHVTLKNNKYKHMKYLNYILILIGAIVAMYSKADQEQNQFVLIGGIVILMIGVYRISKTIRSKNDDEHNSNGIEDN